jgi:hypothetical protein
VCCYMKVPAVGDESVDVHGFRVKTLTRRIQSSQSFLNHSQRRSYDKASVTVVIWEQVKSHRQHGVDLATFSLPGQVNDPTPTLTLHSTIHLSLEAQGRKTGISESTIKVSQVKYNRHISAPALICMSLG